MTNLLDNLNSEQLSAVTHRSGPLLIVAGAGTGKTTVITRRIAYLVEQGLAKPEEILALTFTEKAAGEMEERVDQLLPLGMVDVWISTFHAFCERVLKQAALDIGVPNDFELLNETRQWILVHQNLDRFNLDYYRPLANPSKFIDALLSHFSKCKDERIGPEDYLKYAEELKLSGDSPELLPGGDILAEVKRVLELANAFHTYQRILLENNYLDFGDLINYTLKLFETRPNVLKKFQQKFKYILVDEFQDTNYAQYQLVKYLADVGEKNLNVVGDDDQSIYKFRGASVSNILQFKKDFPESTEVALVENYRSSQEILDLAYDFIRLNDPNRLEVQLNINKRLKSNSELKAEIQVLEGEDLSQELDLVVKKILKLREANPEGSWNDYAILIRSNSSATEMVSRLEAAGIPFYYLANKGLYNKPLISTLISYLNLLGNFHESLALYKVFNLEPFKISTEDISTLTQFTYKKTMSLYEALKNEEALEKVSEDSKDKIFSLLEFLNIHTEMSRSKTAVEVFVYIVRDLGIVESLIEDTIENAQNREFLEQFYKTIETFEENSVDKSLKEYLDQLNLEQQSGFEGSLMFDPSLGPECLKLMTVHASKGLEFENVFVLNMVEQRFPTRRRPDPIEIPDKLVKDILPEGDFHLQEERRLFYVAVTRAKRRLYLTWAKNYGGARAKKPSVFLTEAKLIPSESVSKATGKVVFTKPKTIPKNEVYKKLPTTFSFSEISTFKRCPLEYKYKCFLKLPLPGAAQLSFGITIHKVLQLFLEEYMQNLNNPQVDLFGTAKEIKIPKIELLTELYEREWIDEWYPTKQDKEKYREKGKNILKTFYEESEKNSPKPKYLEKSFRLSIGGFSFVGKIDRVDYLDGMVKILDYKTGKMPKAKNAGDVDQLRVYQWAAQEFLKEKVLSLAYWYLEDNNFKEMPVATGDELVKLQEQLLASMHEIVDAVKHDSFKELHEKSPQHDCVFENLG